jgi:hypothetical protein
MTGQQPLDGRDGPMELNEGALKERFDTAVSGMSPDVTALMNGGIQRGEQLRRRRRAELFGAAGLSAAAAAAVVYSGIASDLFDTNSTGPTDTTPTSVEQINHASTPRSLAAVAIEHLPADEVLGAGSMGNTTQRSTVFAIVGLDTDKGKVELDLVATRRVIGWDRQRSCAPGTPRSETVKCQRSTLSDGSQLVMAAQRFDAGPGAAQYVVRVTVRRADQLVGILEYLRGKEASALGAKLPMADWRLPVSMATMRSIVADPRFGMLTSSEMLAKGRALDNFTNKVTETSSSSSSAVQVSPKSSAPTAQLGPRPPQSSSSGGASAPAPAQRPSKSASSTASPAP